MKTLIGRLFHVSHTVEGTWRLLKRHGWSWQQPARRAIERDDGAVELWKKETSHADNESSCFGGELCRWLVGEGLGLVVGGSG
ncbi:winged helix-turn-helix domain-containing protein, partial [Streptomyces sp. AK08-01B]